MTQPKPSPREHEILHMLTQGFTSKEIGKKLFICKGTVETHKRNLLMKFDARNTTHLVIEAYRKGLIQL